MPDTTPIAPIGAMLYTTPVKAIVPTYLPANTGTILFINNKPLKAVYDATKSKCEVIWAGQVIWSFMTPANAYTKLLFLKLRPTFVVTKELISFTRKPNGQINPQYKMKLTAIVTAPLQGKVVIKTVEILDDSYSEVSEHIVDGDYAVGVKVKRENKERVCLIALNDKREIVVNYPYQGNTDFQNIGKVDETTWAINVDGTLIDATVFKNASELLRTIVNPGNGSDTGSNPGTGGETSGSGGNTDNGGNTGGETGGTDNPPVQEVKPSYLKVPVAQT